jgi:hypothetical protein
MAMSRAMLGKPFWVQNGFKAQHLRIWRLLNRSGGTRSGLGPAPSRTWCGGSEARPSFRGGWIVRARRGAVPPRDGLGSRYPHARGADDAVASSASDALIAARLAALVRRAPGRLRLGALEIDRVERRVLRSGHTLDLLPREYRLLLHLAEHAGQVVLHDELRRAVWGLDFHPGTNVVAVHVSRLRAKLDRGFAAPLLHTEKGVGYRLAVPENAV